MKSFKVEMIFKIGMALCSLIEATVGMKKDVIVIGGGCAGMVAALEAREEGAEVVILNRGPIGLGTNSALSNATFSGPTMHYSSEEYVEDTLQTGKGINHELLVRLMAKEASLGFSLLRSLDLKLVELSDGYYVKSARPDLIPGITLVRALAGEIGKVSGIEVLTGLFACGEVAWGLHGANRKSGNALMECFVFGRIAGRSAAQCALNRSISLPKLKESSKDFSYHSGSSRGTLRWLRRRIREIAWTCAGVVRSEKGLREGLAKVAESEIEVKRVAPQTVHDRRLKEDLMGATFVLKAVLTASLARKESRGSFVREDFPRQDDLNWRINSCLAYNWEEDRLSVRYHPAG